MFLFLSLLFCSDCSLFLLLLVVFIKFSLLTYDTSRLSTSTYIRICFFFFSFSFMFISSPVCDVCVCTVHSEANMHRFWWMYVYAYIFLIHIFVCNAEKANKTMNTRLQVYNGYNQYARFYIYMSMCLSYVCWFFSFFFCFFASSFRYHMHWVILIYICMSICELCFDGICVAYVYWNVYKISFV